MSDIKKINRKFITLITTFALIALLSIAGVVLAWIYIEDENTRFFVIVIPIIILLISSTWFKNALDRTINMYYFIRIRNNAGDPISVVKLKPFDRIDEVLLNQGYKLHRNTSNYNLYYKTHKDALSKTSPQHTMSIIVKLTNKEYSYFLDQVDDDVNQLVDEAYKNEQRIRQLYITQIRKEEELTDKIKEAISEIVFIRTKRGIISTINVAIHEKSGKAVMLYSKDYRPSLYYKEHIETIQNIL